MKKEMKHHTHETYAHSDAHGEHTMGHSDNDVMKSSMHEEHQQHKSHANHSMHAGHEEMFRKKFWGSLVLSIPVLLYSNSVQGWLNFSMPDFPLSLWIVPVFSTIIFLYGGIPFLKMAVPEVKNKKPGMMLLISLAISVAFGYSMLTTFLPLGESFYWELVTLIDIMLLGHWMEMRSVRQASGAMDALAKLMPDTANQIMEDGSIQIVQVAKLQKGDLIIIRPGENIPADGKVFEGKSSVNEAMITGESKPVSKSIGDQVIAGTINQDGSLRVEVGAVGEQTALAGIMRLVKEAQESKSSTQLLADRAAAWLFYAAIMIAVISAVAWGVAVGFNIEILKRVVTILVTACPHALGLAIPLVVAISTAKGAANGILVRDRTALEAARNLDIIVFDKTGTLTSGEFGVVDIQTTAGKTEAKALATAAAAEGDSEHLIAASIRRKAKSANTTIPKASQFEALKGKGIRAMVDGKEVLVGGPRLLEELNSSLPADLENFAHAAGKKGQTVVFLLENQEPTAAFALADAIRPESKNAVRQLQKMGIEVAMLTGDSQSVAKAVAEELGIKRYFAEVLPKDKDKNIAQLRKEGKRVAMVGDGVNDAPALIRANVGIAIGSGTDVAVESAGLILVKNNPLDVVRAIALSKATYKKMIQNLVWATVYNVVALPIAAGALATWGILLSPAVGALFMSLSTVIVAINAQFLRGTALIEEKI